jgi:hypothetical protein
VEVTNGAGPPQAATSVASPHVLWRQLTGLVIWDALWAGSFIISDASEGARLMFGAVGVALSAAVFVDAWRAGVRRLEGSKSFLNMSPMSWGIIASLFFPLTCPVYLISSRKLRTRDSSRVFFVIAAGLWATAVVVWLVYVILKVTGV